MSQLLSKTVLKDRTLWFDGDSTYPANSLPMGQNIVLFVDELNDEIRQYNRLVPSTRQIKVKTENRPFDFEWIIPDEYKNLNVRNYVIEKLQQEIATNGWVDGDGEISKRAVRVANELKLYEDHDLTGVLRVLIFVINTLTNQGVVWGVGRGSSVSSYVLYLIQVHDVDSVKYELSITDFLH
jgi:DNA polymerase III alpha subunit